jgi:hypothetical protein
METISLNFHLVNHKNNSMKKTITTLVSCIAVILIIFPGCQKEKIETTADVADYSAKGLRDRNECRLVFSSTADPSATSDKYYDYNAEGLCSRWATVEVPFGTSVYNQRYNSRGRLIGSEWNFEGELMTTIEFTYLNGRVKKETWYVAGTSDIYDEVWYTYDARGQMVRNESFLNGWYAVTTYTPQGNVKNIDLYFDNAPYFSIRYSYTRQLKNPNNAIPGIPHFFPYYTPTYAASKFYHAGEKEIVYDENGEPVVLFDYDPQRTVWQTADQGYVQSALCYDRLSEGWYNYSFEFDNCGGCGDGNYKKPAQLNRQTRQPLSNIMKRNPKIPVREDLKQLKQLLLQQAGKNVKKL